MSDIEREIDKVAEAVDDAVPVAGSVANEVLPDRSRAMPWIGLGFTVCALLLVPWTIYLGATLPARQLSSHYDVAWVGFDVMLFGALAATAYAVLSRSTWVGLAAGAAAALLAADAWFDVVTASSRRSLIEAAAMSALVELPLAATCGWLCWHAHELSEVRLRHLLRSRRHPHP